MPFLHAHKRRVPTQDVDRSIVIGMGVEATMAADKAGLALAALAVDGSAFRTGLRGIGGIDLHKRPAALFKLVAKDGFKRAPSLIEDTPVKASLGTHVATRLGNCAFGGSRHVPHLEVFKNDRTVATGNAERGLVLPGSPDASSSRRQFGTTAKGLGTAIGATLTPRENALCGTMASFDGFERGRNRLNLASGKRDRVGNAAINADRRVIVSRNFVLDLTGKADVPAQRIKRDGGVLDRAAQRPGIAELDPANLGQPDSGPPGVYRHHLDFTALKSEGVVNSTAAGRRIAGNALEEVDVCLVEIAQCLLLAGLRDGSNPVVLAAQRGQLAGLHDVIESRSGLALIVPPPVAALFEREIVDQSAHTGELLEQRLLLRRRCQLVSEAAKDHLSTIGLWGSNLADNADIRKGRHVVYALHAHLVFVTKYRRDVLSELAVRDLERIFSKVCADFEGELIECNGEDDHVHLLVVYPPKVSLSKLVNSLKGVSSRLLREHRPEISGRYKQGVLWSPSYFVASCGGAPLSIIAEYVRNQREAASGRSRLPPRPEGRGFSRGI